MSEMVLDRAIAESDPDEMVALIVNRGEMAVREVGICRELGVIAVLACADSDIDSKAARDVMALGEEDGRSTIAPLRGNTPAKTYENVPKVIAVGKAFGATHMVPGYGFLAENAKAAQALQDAGIKFVGPRPETMELVGGKGAAKKLAREHGVPVLPGSDTLTSTEHAVQEAEKIGFPIMIKAEHAGGGNGNKVVYSNEELRESYTNMAPRFKDMRLEKYIPNARHIEIQILGDGENVMHLGERDCSSQRKFQKVIEESPALILEPDTKELMAGDALRMARAIKYRSLGTFEFLYDPASNKYWFMEVNCRIQVEAPVTEERYGLNLAKLQLQIEQGHPLPELPQARDNHVIEARLYAEKPEQDFTADSGKIQLLTIPTMDGVRVDRGYDEGDTVPSGVDSTIAKFVVTGATREEAREKLAEMLTNTIVSGVSTNREFLLWLVNTKEFRDNTITTTFIEGAWNKHQRERFRGAEGFLEGGKFSVKPTPRKFASEIFSQVITYKKGGVQRDYASDREAMEDTCAVKYGIYQDDATSIRTALGIWDYKKHAGTMGSEEGNAVAALFELGDAEGLPVTMLVTSAGANQFENMLALGQMDYVAAARKRFPKVPFIVVNNGVNFGGVTASIASLGDVILAVDDSLIGLTGTGMVKKMIGLKETDNLPAGAHGVHDHYNARNIDLIVKDLPEARARVFAYYSTLGLTEPHIRSHSVELNVRDFDSVSQGTRYDRPSDHRFPARIGNLSVTSFHQPDKKLRPGRPRGELTPQKRLEIISHPLRPTAADLLNPALKIFKNVSPLSHKTTLGNVEQYPSIIGAIAELGGQPVMVLGQQTQRKRDHLTRRMHKVYVPQGPNDLRWAQRKIDLAERLGLPIILIGDTAGASAYLEDEKYGVSYEIANFLARLHTVKVPVVSLNIGQNGSGGGLTFIRPMDAAADSSNSLSLVSTIDVMTRIVLGKWPKNNAERAVLLNQIKDGTPEGRKRMGQIDEIVDEPPGGAHTDWMFFAQNVLGFLLRSQARLNTKPIEQILDERFERTKRSAQFATYANIAVNE